MNKPQVGFVGYRGMVGSVLMERMHEEDDFANIDPVFFSTSQPGENGPEIDGEPTILADAYDLVALSALNIIVSCQGSDYTKRIHPELRNQGWDGYWIDAASHLRYADSSVLVLDPVNRPVIDKALAAGKKDLIGANCTVSTMLMGLSGLFAAGLVKSAVPATYQAVSGAGAKNVTEMLSQMEGISAVARRQINDPASSILDIDRTVTDYLRSDNLPTANFGHAIAGNMLPYIDTEVDDGQSREEWKAEAETNLILDQDSRIVVDGICARIGSMRSHAQFVFLELTQDLPLPEIEEIIRGGNEWVDLVPNNKEQTLARLTPVAVSGTLNVAVGRVRKNRTSPRHINTFIVGDQLLWGAAEPLRRALNIVTSR